MSQKENKGRNLGFLKIYVGRNMKISSTKQNGLFIKKLPHTAIAISSLMFLAMACESKATDVQSNISRLSPERPEIAQSLYASNNQIPTHVRRIQFKQGTSSVVVKNTVVRGDRDIYLLKANKGQRLHGLIASTENNAVIDVLDPGGKSIQQEVTKVDMLLPSTGNFKIVVGGTRGNVNYRLNIGID
jgi:hypothetical protein